MTKGKVFYFGCLNSKGHHYYRPGSDSTMADLPGPWEYEVDGGLQPHTGFTNQGDAALHHRDGWTCLAWWDMTMDTRPASCSAVIVDRVADAVEMLRLLGEHFPAVAKRQTRPITVLAERTTQSMRTFRPRESTVLASRKRRTGNEKLGN
jgi:hypothetical protein